MRYLWEYEDAPKACASAAQYYNYFPSENARQKAYKDGFLFTINFYGLSISEEDAEFQISKKENDMDMPKGSLPRDIRPLFVELSPKCSHLTARSKLQRFFVDKRSGCIAVRDRTKTDPEYQGLHEDTEGVVWFQMGKRAQTTKCPTCGHEVSRMWEISEEQISEAEGQCTEMNKKAEEHPEKLFFIRYRYKNRDSSGYIEGQYINAANEEEAWDLFTSNASGPADKYSLVSIEEKPRPNWSHKKDTEEKSPNKRFFVYFRYIPPEDYNTPLMHLPIENMGFLAASADEAWKLFLKDVKNPDYYQKEKIEEA